MCVIKPKGTPLIQRKGDRQNSSTSDCQNPILMCVRVQHSRQDQLASVFGRKGRLFFFFCFFLFALGGGDLNTFEIRKGSRQPWGLPPHLGEDSLDASSLGYPRIRTG